jgi:hypothetical protein
MSAVLGLVMIGIAYGRHVANLRRL